jgi:hypothetical protein
MVTLSAGIPAERGSFAARDDRFRGSGRLAEVAVCSAQVASPQQLDALVHFGQIGRAAWPK